MPAPLPTPAQTRQIMAACKVQVSPEFGIILDAEPRELVISGGWRGGKSTVLAGKIMKRIPFQMAINEQNHSSSLYWLVGPDYDQVRQEFRYVLQWCRALDIVESASMPQEGQWEMRLRGSMVIETKSAGHPERLGSVAPDYIGVCEAGQCSDETRLMMLGRAAEKRANICYAGTLEDDEGHAQWAWYQELASLWDAGAECEFAGVGGHLCAQEHGSYRLPSWSNPVVFPQGRYDPEITRLEGLYDRWTFARKIAGIPMGIQFAVYPQTMEKNFLRTISQLEEMRPVIGRPGGVDFGTVHPTVLCVAHVIEDPRDSLPEFRKLPVGILIVRETRWHESKPEDMDGTLRCDPGDSGKLRQAKTDLSDTWGTNLWNFDPNERYMANNFAEHGSATSYSESAREARVSLLTTRFNYDKIILDIKGPGNRKLLNQLRRIHRRKTATGELKYVRIDDDGGAALEDCAEAWDGKPHRVIPTENTLSQPKYGRRRKREYSKV